MKRVRCAFLALLILIFTERMYLVMFRIGRCHNAPNLFTTIQQNH